MTENSDTQKIKINSKWYSIPEILNSTNEIRKKIMHALQDNIKGDDDLLQVDLIGVKKSKSVFCYKRVTEVFFSSINIKMNMVMQSSMAVERFSTAISMTKGMLRIQMYLKARRSAPFSVCIALSI